MLIFSLLCYHVSAASPHGKAMRLWDISEDSSESSVRVIVSISVRILLSIIRNAGTDKHGLLLPIVFSACYEVLLCPKD